MGLMKPKVDKSALEAQRKAAADEKKRLDAERLSAEKERERLAGKRAADQRRRSGRASLIATAGGELGTSEKLG